VTARECTRDEHSVEILAVFPTNAYYFCTLRDCGKPVKDLCVSAGPSSNFRLWRFSASERIPAHLLHGEASKSEFLLVGIF
jgi:hypothetical protein